VGLAGLPPSRRPMLIYSVRVSMRKGQTLCSASHDIVTVCRKRFLKGSEDWLSPGYGAIVDGRRQRGDS
jgi:hypothetical protein